MFTNKLIPRREEGQGLVEYALSLVLVAIVVIAILLLLGPQVASVYTRVAIVLNGGNPGVITSFTTSVSGGGIKTLTVNVTVSEAGNVTLKSDGKTATAACTTSCTVSVSGVPGSGDFSLSSAAGGSLNWSY